MPTLRWILVGLWITATATQSRVSAQEARLPVKVVGDRLVVRCEASTRFRRIPVNLLVDFDRSCELELHNLAAAGLRLDEEGGVPITLHFPGNDITLASREHGDEDFLNDFTRLYSRELGEVACVGALGAKFFKHHHVVFDLHGGFIVLTPERTLTGQPLEETTGTAVTSLTLTNDLVWVPVRLEDGSISNVALGTTRYDSVVDRTLCLERKRPAGDVGSVRVKSFDFSKHVALRPEQFVQVHPDGAFGMLGINVLEHFRVEVDRTNRSIRFEETVQPRFPDADLEYFQARVLEEPDPILAWLDKHSKTRLAREAAVRVLDLLLDAEAKIDQFTKAIAWMDQTRIDDLKATEALHTMKKLVAARRADVAILAGEQGVKSGRQDRYPESVHKLHAHLGELLVDADQSEKAWEHLLSAAFGLPEDGFINFNLGRFYEKEGRHRRAMSRYVQAVITPEAGSEAVKALERLQPKMGAEPLSVDLVDKLVAGKVQSFSAADRFKPTDKNSSNRVVLVEFFANAHFGRRLQEGWVSFAEGGAMAAEAILSHYPRSHVAVLCHHVNEPEPTALQNELSLRTADLYRSRRPLYTKVNGTRTGPGAERWRKAEELYEANRALIGDALVENSSHVINATGRVHDGIVSGEVTVEGPSDLDLVVEIVLAERGVLYPGKGKVVVHRMVVRGPLTKVPRGVPYKPENGRMSIPFNAKLDEITAKNETFLEQFEKDGGGACTRLSTKIDPRQVDIVAMLRYETTREVLQAVHITPQGAGGNK